MNSNVHLWQYLVELFSQYDFNQTNGLQKVKNIYFMCNNFFLDRALCEIMKQNMKKPDMP